MGKDTQNPRSLRTETYGLRLTPEEMEALEQAAGEAGESVADYLRKAVALRQQGAPAIPALNVSVGIYSLQVDYHGAAWGTAPHSTTPEDIPDQMGNVPPPQEKTA